MVYLFLDKNRIKLLNLKKNLFGQQETLFFEKHHEVTLLDKGKVANSDVLASAIKEAFTLAAKSPIKERDIFLILPQESFHFLRTDIPADIAPSALHSFIKDKARSIFPVELETCYGDYFVKEHEGQKVITFFALDKESLDGFKKSFALLDLKVYKLLPDTLAYFKLFEKTLRKEKKETIFYVDYDRKHLVGYVFDSFGLITPERWSHEIKNGETVEELLKKKVLEFEERKHKPNRIILSGNDSEHIRQDTFTKSVGAWTNPLKRIIPNFYQEYVKQLVVDPKTNLSILQFDVCFGAFIFNQENKHFMVLKRDFGKKSERAVRLPKVSLPGKEIMLFIASFSLSFLVFSVLSRTQLNVNSILKRFEPTATPTLTPPPPTPTPTLSMKKDEVKIKILNGSGTAGKASEVKDILKNQGYQEILTGNADTFDYEQTEINTKKGLSGLSNILQDDLKDYTKTIKKGVLKEEEAADVVIIIGKDFK